MNRDHKVFCQPRPETRLIIANACGLNLKNKQLNKLTMKTITLTNQNGSSIKVATDPKDGRLHIVDNDNQLTRDVLPSGVYSSEGVSDFTVKDGQQVKSKLSIKAGIKPRPTAIPMQSIGQKMVESQHARKKKINDLRMSGKI